MPGIHHIVKCERTVLDIASLFPLLSLLCYIIFDLCPLMCSPSTYIFVNINVFMHLEIA